MYSELYDILDLKRNSKKDNRELKFQKRFDWTEEEIQGFLRKYHKQIIVESNFIPGAKRILKLLKSEGNSLILITARGGINKDMIKLTEEILRQNEILLGNRK